MNNSNLSFIQNQTDSVEILAQNIRVCAHILCVLSENRPFAQHDAESVDFISKCIFNLSDKLCSKIDCID